jgi:hypothetical protein
MASMKSVHIYSLDTLEKMVDSEYNILIDGGSNRSTSNQRIIKVRKRGLQLTLLHLIMSYRKSDK